MEYIKEALARAKSSPQVGIREHKDKPASSPKAPLLEAAQSAAQRWRPPRVALSARHLEDRHIVSFAMVDPVHIVFNLLRTRVKKALAELPGKSIAVTSPTPGCGKTMVALNLAFSFARLPDCRVVVIDLDLRKSAVAHTLGIEAAGSLIRYFQGSAAPEDCFVEVCENLVVGLSRGTVRHSSEMMQSQKMLDLMAFVSNSLVPDIIIFDLPPMHVSDDVLAFLPYADASLLVIGAGITTPAEVAECERQVSKREKLLGIVLNKCEDKSADYYYYASHTHVTG